MAKAEWGHKRSCPKCGERFYDLGKDDPVVCIACGHEWTPEPLLKSKQPLSQEVGKKPLPAKKSEVEDDEDVSLDDDEDIALDDDEDVDLEDEDDVGLAVDDEDV